MRKGGSVVKLFIKALGFMAMLVLSGAACAMSMGSINVTSALGEPLKAEIGLSDIAKADKSKLSVQLASPEAFKDAGLDYPATLPKLKFRIDTRASGEYYLEITSVQPLNEPFVNLLVELNWPSGKLLRSYTFLLDPPGFKPEQPKTEPVQPLEPSVASVPETKTEPVSETPAVEPADKVLPAAAPAPADKPAAKPAANSNVASGDIKVKHGDTLSKIAREVKSPDVTLERMLVAMYRANEAAFDGNNMNRLKTGKILRVPEESELDKLAQPEAVKEIRAQVADWHAYRMRLAAASSSVAEQAPKQEASGKISTTVADKTPPAKESAKEVVRLSKGEAPGDKTAAGGNAKALQDKLHAMQEEAVARDKMLKDSNERIAVLEKNIKEMQRLLELKGQPVPQQKPAEMPKPVEEKPAAMPEAVTVAPLAPASAVAPAKPVKKPISKPAPVPPSLLDEILGEPLYLAGGAAALLALGGLGFVSSRRRGKGAKNKGDTADTGAHIAAPVAPSPDTGDFTQTATVQSGPEESEGVDPLSEADLFLNFGRDVQAEDILKDALKKTPDNQQIRLKLLSIYANRKDTKTFGIVAREVQDSGDAAAWAQAAEMGHKLEPGNPLYGEDDAAVAGEEAAQDETTIVQSASSLDFDLGLGTPDAGATVEEMDVPVDVTTDTSTGLDIDLGMGMPEEASAEVADEVKTDTSSVMDFDLGLGEEAGDTAAPELDSGTSLASADEPLSFDITSEFQSLSGEQTEEPQEKVEEAVPDMNTLAFDMPGADSAPAAEENKATPAEVETPEDAGDMAFTLDFPTPEEPAADNVAEPVKEPAIDLSEISLDVDVPAPARAPAAPQEDVKDARWHDVATKLDLARAYQEMGDASGAREILDEVLKEGDAQQRAAAEFMIQQLSA